MLLGDDYVAYYIRLSHVISGYCFFIRNFVNSPNPSIQRSLIALIEGFTCFSRLSPRFSYHYPIRPPTLSVVFGSVRCGSRAGSTPACVRSSFYRYIVKKVATPATPATPATSQVSRAGRVATKVATVATSEAVCLGHLTRFLSRYNNYHSDRCRWQHQPW